jgi:membrane protease subunit (stomatin/prohibitin family)
VNLLWSTSHKTETYFVTRHNIRTIQFATADAINLPQLMQTRDSQQ